jgi:copper chaperone CopZ
MAPGMQTHIPQDITLVILDYGCASCVAKTQQTLTAAAGVDSTEIDLADRRVMVVSASHNRCISQLEVVIPPEIVSQLYLSWR